MRGTWRIVSGAALIALCALVVAACGDDNSNDTTTASSSGAAKTLKIAFVCATPALDPFYAPMEQGAKDAAKELGVSLTYTGLSKEVTAAAMMDVLRPAISGKPDAIVACDYFPQAQDSVLKQAAEGGTPVVITNSGSLNTGAGAIATVGQPETLGGRGAGERMVAAGVKHAMCVNHSPGNPATVDRCKGFESAFKAKGLKVKVLNLPPQQYGNIGSQQAAIKGALAADETIDGVLSLNPQLGPAAARAVRDLGRTGDVSVGTFDISNNIIADVKSGALLFAIWQQPYLQGYMPVLIAALQVRHGQVPPGVTSTGPAFVTKDNVDFVSGALKDGLG